MNNYEILDGYVKILDQDKEEIIKKLLEPLRKCEKLRDITYQEDGSTDRNHYERDYTRVLYSPSFRRLQGKMQLLAIQSDKFFRNRLTHSLEVAQIARSIARELTYDPYELYVVEAGALAHDIGNPPFGHYGEQILNNIAKDFGGYEGNAQTFRILTQLEKKAGHGHGLNLTKRTILSVVKYFMTYNNCEEQGFDLKDYKYIYDDSYEKVKNIIDETGVVLRTLDVQIIDVADEIAYAAHDLEDGLSQGLFTIDEILFAFKQKYPHKLEPGTKLSENDIQENIYVFNFFNAIVNKARDWAEENATSTTEYSSLFNNKLSSSITYYLINNLGLVPVDEEARKKTNAKTGVQLYLTTLRKLAEGLKKITFQCVCNTDKVYYYEQAGEKVIESLYHLYYQNSKYLPEEYRLIELNKYIELKKKDILLEKEKRDLSILEIQHKRNIIDYISGMMDSFAVSQYERFFGVKALEGFYDASGYSNKSCHTMLKEDLLGGYIKEKEDE